MLDITANRERAWYQHRGGICQKSCWTSLGWEGQSLPICAFVGRAVPAGPWLGNAAGFGLDEELIAFRQPRTFNCPVAMPCAAGSPPRPRSPCAARLRPADGSARQPVSHALTGEPTTTLPMPRGREQPTQEEGRQGRATPDRRVRRARVLGSVSFPAPSVQGRQMYQGTAVLPRGTGPRPRRLQQVRRVRRAAASALISLTPLAPEAVTRQ